MKLRTKIARALRLNKLFKWLGLGGTLDTDKALRALKRENIDLKQQVQSLQEQVHVWIDPAMRLRQRGYAQSAWNSEPERNTNPVRQAVHDTFDTAHLPTAPGGVNRRFTDKLREQTSTRKPHPTRDLRKLHLQRYDGPPPPGSTLHETPAFLQDQARKIS